MFSKPRRKTKITSKSVLHPLVEGLTRDDPLAGAPCFLGSKQACLSHHWKRHKWALVLTPLGVQSLRSGQGVFRLLADPVGCLGSFGSVDGPEGRNIVAEKEKGNVDDRVTGGLLVQVCVRIKEKLGVKLLTLDMTCCSSRLCQDHPSSSRRRVHGWWSLNAHCSTHSVLG